MDESILGLNEVLEMDEKESLAYIRNTLASLIRSEQRHRLN